MFTSVVLNRGQFAPPKDIYECLKTFLVVIQWEDLALGSPASWGTVGNLQRVARAADDLSCVLTILKSSPCRGTTSIFHCFSLYRIYFNISCG